MKKINYKSSRFTDTEIFYCEKNNVYYLIDYITIFGFKVNIRTVELSHEDVSMLNKIFEN